MAPKPSKDEYNNAYPKIGTKSHLDVHGESVDKKWLNIEALKAEPSDIKAFKHETVDSKDFKREQVDSKDFKHEYVDSKQKDESIDVKLFKHEATAADIHNDEAGEEVQVQIPPMDSEVVMNERAASISPTLPPVVSSEVTPMTEHSANGEDAMMVDTVDLEPIEDIDDDEEFDLMNDDDTSETSSRASTTAGYLMDDLAAALQSYSTFDGNYYAVSIPSNAVNPCLNIHGVGYVGLPLSSRDAQGIIECFTQSRSTEAGAADDTWVIDADKINFENPDWDDWLRNQAVKAIEASLGAQHFSKTLKWELDKLILCGVGSRFLSQENIEDTGDRIAKAIVVLPSFYTGGEIHLSHSLSTNTIDFAPKSLHSTSILAWHIDVKRDVERITSGYRLALCYTLIGTTAVVPRPTLPDMTKSINDLRRILEKWHGSAYGTKDTKNNFIAYALKHYYDVATLREGTNALKGADAHLLGHLRIVAQEFGYVLSLANLAYTIDGYMENNGELQPYTRICRRDGSSEVEFHGDAKGNDLKINDLIGSYYVLSDLVDLQGQPLVERDTHNDDEDALPSSSLTVSQSKLIPEKPFKEMKPNRKEYEELCHGSGRLTIYYDGTVVVLVHNDDATKFFFAAGGTSYALRRLRQSVSDVPSTDEKVLANLVVEAFSDYRYIRDEEAKAISDYALRWEDLELWKKVVKKSRCGFTTFGIDNLVRAWRVFTLEDVSPSYEDILHSTTRLGDRFDFLQALPRCAAHDISGQIDAWVDKQTLRTFCSLAQLTKDDIPVLIAVGQAKGAFFLFEKILPQLVKDPALPDFTITLVQSLHQQKASIPNNLPSKLPSVNEQPAGINYLDTLIEKLLEYIAKWSLVYPILDLDSSNSEAQKNERLLAVQEASSRRSMELIKLSHLTGHMAPCNRMLLLLLKIQAHPMIKFQQIYTPLVSCLRPFMRAKGIDLLSPVFSDFLRALVVSHLHIILGAQGHEHKEKIRKIGCGCSDCVPVDEFIMSSERIVETFRLAKIRRVHLEGRLGDATDLLSFILVQKGTPHGLQVTKRPEIVAAQQWDSRLAQAKAFLGIIGSDDDISRLMGSRYGDVLQALAGEQPFALTVGDPATGSSLLKEPSPLVHNPSNTVGSPAETSVAGTKRKRTPV